ncbi:MAG: DUF1513 domain-containing protein [Pseudomonadota bacterium]
MRRPRPQAPTRRAVLAGGVAGGLTAGFAPALSWADAGDPRYLAAARHPGGDYRLHGLAEDGTSLFSLPLPDRGHAAASHPSEAVAVAFARRPGTFALVIDCPRGTILHRLAAPEGRHFYGHGTYSLDGSVLFTTENDYEGGEGRIGLWSATEGYRRMGEIASGGIGPHEVVRLPGGDVLAVANGGILTHPDTGRAKLNLPTMRSTLTYLTVEDGVIEQVALPDDLRLNSIRHLAVSAEGKVAMAMQWQGSLSEVPALAALHRRGDPAPTTMTAPPPDQRATRGYAGSVAFSRDGGAVAITAPRGGRMHVFDTATADHRATLERVDICGVARGPAGFLATDGTGGVMAVDGTGRPVSAPRTNALAWDNHLVAV